MKILLLAVALLSSTCFGLAQLRVTSAVPLGQSKWGAVYHIYWKADASGNVPGATLNFQGFITKVVTKPGSTAPTDNYDITCGDPLDPSIDVFASAVTNRDQTVSEQAYPVATGATVPVLASQCLLDVTGNSVNGADGDIEVYVAYP